MRDAGGGAAGVVQLQCALLGGAAQRALLPAALLQQRVRRFGAAAVDEHGVQRECQLHVLGPRVAHGAHLRQQRGIGVNGQQVRDAALADSLVQQRRAGQTALRQRRLHVVHQHGRGPRGQRLPFGQRQPREGVDAGGRGGRG